MKIISLLILAGASISFASSEKIVQNDENLQDDGNDEDEI